MTSGIYLLLSMALGLGPTDTGILIYSICVFPITKEKHMYLVYLKWYMLHYWASAALSSICPSGKKMFWLGIHENWTQLYYYILMIRRNLLFSYQKLISGSVHFQYCFSSISYIFPTHQAPEHTLSYFGTTSGLTLSCRNAGRVVTGQ